MTSNKNKMHARNIFKNPPDYTDLAIKYPDFRKVCKLELSGKVSINYKNEDSLRALTQMLLLEYFQLKIEFAPGSLIPTLPLRLNYILWLEDILAQDDKIRELKGIDIGCGSSCIYSLLAAKKNNWHMLALESNQTNLEYAKRNIELNNLQFYIELFKQNDKTHIFKEYFDSTMAADEVGEHSLPFDFCLCNPPFYDTACTTTKNRNKRPPPHNCPTGTKDELSCEGGEVKFVQRIINESVEYSNRIRIFTSMLGLKSSVSELLDYLKIKDIKNTFCTEFHQGNTTRWGIGWTFQT